MRKAQAQIAESIARHRINTTETCSLVIAHTKQGGQLFRRRCAQKIHRTANCITTV